MKFERIKVPHPTPHRCYFPLSPKLVFPLNKNICRGSPTAAPISSFPLFGRFWALVTFVSRNRVFRTIFLLFFFLALLEPFFFSSSFCVEITLLFPFLSYTPTRKYRGPFGNLSRNQRFFHFSPKDLILDCSAVFYRTPPPLFCGPPRPLNYFGPSPPPLHRSRALKIFWKIRLPGICPSSFLVPILIRISFSPSWPPRFVFSLFSSAS